MEEWLISLIAIGGILVGLVFIFLLLKLYTWCTKGYYEVTKDLTGMTILVTGANTGIGKETALALADKGARVIMACRNMTKARIAQEEISSMTGNYDIIVKKLDMCSFKSIRAFADDILRTENHLDVLINNAGMYTPPDYKITENGFNETLQTNHLGPFLLTLLLLDLLKQSAPSRIVNLASIASWNGIGDTKNLTISPNQSLFVTYAQTKTFNILFTVELANKLKGTGVTVNCCHPGTVQSELIRSHDGADYPIVGFIINNFGRTPKEGAMTTLYLATSDEVENISGKYFCDCKQSIRVPPWATNKTRAKSLWESSLKAVGLEEIQEFKISSKNRTLVV